MSELSREELWELLRCRLENLEATCKECLELPLMYPKHRQQFHLIRAVVEEAKQTLFGR